MISLVDVIEVQISRKERAISLLKKFNIDGWLVISDGNDPNLEYLLGVELYSTSIALLTQDGLFALVSKLEESMVDYSYIDEVLTYYGQGEFLQKFTSLLGKVRRGTVLINNASPLLSAHASRILSGHEKLVKNIGELLGLNFVPADQYVTKLRSIKTDKEIEALKLAVEETEKAIIEVIEEHIRIGMTEKEVSAILYKYIFSKGSPSFETIVAFGENSANPHHKTSDKKLREGEIGYIDAGIKILGMCGDITRAFFTKNVGEEEYSVYKAVLEAQNRAINTIKPHIDPTIPDKIARETFRELGYDDELFSHGLGHPLGVEVHDVGPALSRFYRGEMQLAPGMAVTVEPALYFKGKWGIRLEDDIVVTSDGYLRLSRSPSEPPIIE